MECMISRRRRFPNEHLALNLSHKFGFKDSKILGPGWLPKLLVLWHYRRRKDLFRSGPQYISWPRRLAASVSLGESLHEVVFSASFGQRGENCQFFNHTMSKVTTIALSVKSGWWTSCSLVLCVEKVTCLPFCTSLISDTPHPIRTHHMIHTNFFRLPNQSKSTFKLQIFNLIFVPSLWTL